MINCHQIMATSQASPPATAARHHQPCPCYCWQRRCRRLEQCGQQVRCSPKCDWPPAMSFFQSLPCREEAPDRTSATAVMLFAQGQVLGKTRHAADTAPLEGLPILRCAIYEVANFKNEACGNGGIGFDFFEFLTCCTCCRMIIRGVGGGGWGGCINVLDEHFLHVTEDAHVAHAVVWSSGGGGGGGRGVY